MGKGLFELVDDSLTCGISQKQTLLFAQSLSHLEHLLLVHRLDWKLGLGKSIIHLMLDIVVAGFNQQYY